MERGSGSPRSQGVEENRVRILRFVGVILMEEMVGRVRFLHQAGQLRAKQIDLPIVENLDSSDISLLVEPGELFLSKPEFLPLRWVFRLLEKVADWCVRCRQIHRYHIPLGPSAYRILCYSRPSACRGS